MALPTLNHQNTPLITGLLQKETLAQNSLYVQKSRRNPNPTVVESGWKRALVQRGAPLTETAAVLKAKSRDANLVLSSGMPEQIVRYEEGLHCVTCIS